MRILVLLLLAAIAGAGDTVVDPTAGRWTVQVHGDRPGIVADNVRPDPTGDRPSIACDVKIAPEMAADGQRYVLLRTDLPDGIALDDRAGLSFAYRFPADADGLVQNLRVGLTQADGPALTSSPADLVADGQWHTQSFSFNDFAGEPAGTRWNDVRVNRVLLRFHVVPPETPGTVAFSAQFAALTLPARTADEIRRVREKLPALLVLGAAVSDAADTAAITGNETRHYMPDPKLETQLRDQGFEIGYGAWCPALTLPFLRQFNVVVLTEMPFPENRPQYADVLAMAVENLRAYVAEGGGLLILRKPLWVFGQDIEYMNKVLLAGWGASVPQEVVVDPRHELKVHGRPLCWTNNIVPGPLTEGVAGLYYSPIYSFYHDYTSPVIVDNSWTVLAKGMPSARSLSNPKGRRRDRDETTPGQFESEPPLLAAREVGAGRVVLWPISDTLVWHDAYHLAWGDGLAMDGNRDRQPGNAARLLANLFAWLREPGAGRCGGFIAPPERQEIFSGFEQIDWDSREPRAMRFPNDYVGLIGACSDLTDGEDTPAAMIQAARDAGYDFLAFNESLDKLTPDTFAKLKDLCAAASDDTFCAIPGYRYVDESGNTWVSFSRQLSFPKPPWFSKQYPGRLRNNNAHYRAGGNPPMILVHSNLNPEAPWFQGCFKGFAVYTYDDGKLHDDSLAHYLELEWMRYRIFPTVVRFVDSAAAVRAAATGGFQTHVRWFDNGIDMALSGGSGAMHGQRRFYCWPSYVSEGPTLETFEVMNFGMSDLAIPGNERMRIHFRVRAAGGLAEVRLMDGPDLFRRWLPTGDEFATTFDHFHERQHNFVVVAVDKEGRRLVSGERRTIAQENRFQRCSDNYNTMPGGKYAGSPEGLDNLRGIEDYTFHRGFGYARFPTSTAFGNDTVRPAIKYFPVLASRFCTIIQLTLAEHYAPDADANYDRTDKPECAEPNDTAAITLGYTLFTPWRDGPIVSRVDGNVHLLRDIPDPQAIILGRISGGAHGGGIFAGQRRDGDWLAGDCTAATLRTELPAGGCAAVFPDPFRGGNGLIALDDHLAAGGRGNAIMPYLEFTGDLTAGRDLPFAFLAVTGPLADAPTNDFVLAVRDRFGFDGSPAWTLTPTQGEVVATGFPVRLQATDHAFRAAAGRARLPLALPVTVAGLEPRWDAVVWYPGSNSFEVSEYRLSRQFHRYTTRVTRRETDRLLHLPVLADGTGYAQVDVAGGDREVFIGNPLVCDRPDLFLTLVDTRPDRAAADVHNPIDDAVEITLRPAPGFDLLGDFARPAIVPPGTTVTVKL